MTVSNKNPEEIEIHFARNSENSSNYHNTMMQHSMNFDFGAVQNCANLTNLERCRRMNIKNYI